jgi:hypothetical protein
MNPRTSIALVALAALIGIAVYWFEIRGQGLPDASRLLLRFEPAQVRALELPLEGGGRARLVRAEGERAGWALEQPIAFAADAGVVDGALENLAKLERKGEIDPGPADLEAFGFAADGGAVRVEPRDGGALELEVGGPAPLGSESYVRRDGRIYTVEQWRAQSLRPTLVQLRDKRISRFETEEIDRLEILEDGHARVALERRAGEGDSAGWWLVAPQAERADADQVRRTLSDLVLARATDFVDEVKRPSEYGLEPPRLEVRLRGGERSEAIALGRGKDKAYARLDGRPPLFEIPERVLDSIPRELFAYRDKKVLAVDDAKVDRIVLSFPREGTRYAFRKREGRFQPEDPAIEVGSEKLDDVLFTVSDLDASAIVDQSPDLAALGLAPPRVRVGLEGANSEELGWIELGEPTADEGLPARSSRGERVWRVSNELGRELPLGEEAFWNSFAKRKAAEPAPAPDAAP